MENNEKKKKTFLEVENRFRIMEERFKIIMWIDFPPTPSNNTQWAEWKILFKHTKTASIYNLKVLFCSVAFNLIRKPKYPGTHLEGSSVRSFFSHLGFTPVTAVGGLSLSREWRNGEDSRWTTKEMMVDSLSVLSSLSSSSSLLCSSGGAAQGLPTKAFQSHRGSISSPKPFMSIGTSAA